MTVPSAADKWKDLASRKLVYGAASFHTIAPDQPPAWADEDESTYLCGSSVAKAEDFGYSSERVYIPLAHYESLSHDPANIVVQIEQSLFWKRPRIRFYRREHTTNGIHINAETELSLADAERFAEILLAAVDAAREDSQ